MRRHPWELARSDFFQRVLAGAGLLDGTPAVLDVGAGDAWLARQLAAVARLGTIVCWDTAYSDALLADRDLGRAEGLRHVAARPAERFDLVLLLDVLEHVEDDAAFLRTLVDDNVAPGGHLLVSVPAWPALYSSHDARLRHHRRYTPQAARALLRGAGLELLRGAGLFHSLLPARALQLAAERLAPRRAAQGDAGSWSAPELVTSAIRAALAADASLSLVQAKLGVSLPGLSFWVLCRKPSP